MTDAKTKEKLSLDEKVERSFTRREWSVIVMALSFIPDYAPQSVKEMSDRITDSLQGGDTAPVGVFVRFLKEANSSDR